MGAIPDVPLSDGRLLRVRHASAGDVAALEELYEGLSPEDRYRRFFSAFHPGRRMLEANAARADGGGTVLVADVVSRGAPPRVVAEADYWLLPNGNAEFAVTVDEHWRGWLGPYLLELLAADAAAKGIPNLEADVLTTNAPMLSLVRHRGYATVAHSDWTVVRVCIASAGDVPTWPPGASGVRVLVETPGARWRAEEAARQAGLAVLACPGPQVARRCPLLHGEACPLVAGADVVVMARPPDDDAWQALARAHAAPGAGPPVVVDPGEGAETDVDLVARVRAARDTFTPVAPRRTGR